MHRMDLQYLQASLQGHHPFCYIEVYKIESITSFNCMSMKYEIYKSFFESYIVILVVIFRDNNDIDFQSDGQCWLILLWYSCGRM